MIDRLRIALEKAGTISDFRITETLRSGVEWYFIGDKLETARAKETADYEVVVYADSPDKKTRGACTFRVLPSMSDSELESSIARALATAKNIKNAWYPIPDKAHAAGADAFPTSGFAGKEPASAMAGLRDALYRYNNNSSASINSLELFLTKVDERIVNSRGVDVAFTSWRGFSEFIVNATAGDKEVELYGDITFSEPDYEKLAQEMRNKLVEASDRLRAVPTPDCAGLPVILRGSSAEELYSFWFNACQNAALYQHVNPFAPGEDTGASGKNGDIVELSAVPFVKGSPQSRAYDLEGMALKAAPCIVKGKLEKFTGPMKYAHYLSMPATGSHQLFALAGGKLSKTELAKENHVEASAFSDFYMDPTTGDFGGEIRLAYLIKDGKRTPVSGGSITGNIMENRGMIRFSSELSDYNSCRAPETCLVPKARIAKAE